MIAPLLLALLAQIGVPQGGPDAGQPPAVTAPAPAASAPKSYSARAAPSSVRIGQPFVIEVAITDAASVRYDLPRDLRLGTLDVRGVAIERAPQGDDVVTTARIEVALFDALGAAQLPDVVFTAVGPDGVAHLVVPGPPITVESTAEGDELDDIGGPQVVQVFSPVPLWVAGGALLTAAVAFAVARWLRRRRAAPAAPPAPVGTPDERALAALDALEARGLEGDGRAFYFALSDVVRGFLEESGARNAREMTTSELVDSLVGREVPGLSLAQLGAWLERGDLHRFARAPATVEGARADVEKAREMIRGVAAALRPAAAPGGEEAA